MANSYRGAPGKSQDQAEGQKLSSALRFPIGPGGLWPVPATSLLLQLDQVVLVRWSVARFLPMVLLCHTTLINWQSPGELVVPAGRGKKLASAENEKSNAQFQCN